MTQGTFGGDNHVDYCSLCFQIEEAKELSYSSKEIVSGMIKAMKNPLKKYCEGKRNWTLETLMASVRAFAKVQTSEEVMDEMKAYSQQQKQSEIEYLVAMCAYRDNILAMTKQEEHPLDEGRVEKNFLRALAVGFKKDTIRLMLAPVLKKDGLSDHELMREVNEAVEADVANRKKTKGEKSAGSNNLNVESVVEEVAKPSSAEPQWVRELAKISGKMDGICDSVRLLEGRVNSIAVNGPGSGGSSGGNGSGATDGQRYRFIKCQPCQKEGRFCKHCSLCGKGGHKRRDCTEAAENG